MLTFEEVPGTNIVEFTINGPITRASYDKLADCIDGVIERDGKVRLMEIVGHIGSVEPSAIWKDLKWGPKHLKDMTHIAVVADQKWISWLVAPINPFVSAKIKAFHLDEIEEARAWVRAGR